MKKLFLLAVFFLMSPTVLSEGRFQPYEIKAGVPYYSDQYFVNDDVSELGEEKNYEEVYQYYNYYEAVFDEEQRIISFKAYKQGAIEFSETYFYDDGERPVKKIVTKPDGTESSVDF